VSARVWAAVTIVVSALTAVTVLSVTGSASTDLLTVIGSAVIPTVTILLVGEQIAGKVDGVHTQVNGRMSELIAAAKKPDNDSQ
jgi:hypothetical protein